MSQHGLDSAHFGLQPGNVIRETDYGIGVSVVSGTGATAVTGNLISGARLGAR